jgi:hypothetical protein
MDQEADVEDGHRSDAFRATAKRENPSDTILKIKIVGQNQVRRENAPLTRVQNERSIQHRSLPNALAGVSPCR